MLNRALIVASTVLLAVALSSTVSAQPEVARDAYAIFERNCLNCHGPDGAFRETLLMEHSELIAGGTVVPGDPDASELYKRLLGPTENGVQMPFGQEPLPAQSIDTVRRWILAGAPDWTATTTTLRRFITPREMLTSIESHLNSLSSFDRSFARYFTMTHLYNAAETPEILAEYRTALYKLVNSLSWGSGIINPQPIDPLGMIFYIDLRHYEWDRNDGWTKLEEAYPYHISFDAPAHLALQNQLGRLQTQMKTDVPSVHVDWFIARASTPPLYHELLSLPLTDSELETRLEVDVAANLVNAPGVRVWRAGFKNSGVSNHNRVVERHISRYGAYWKSYDFAGSAGRQNILTHPLNFTHDGGEVIFNLPNGLQGYYLVDGNGLRLDEAPISIVSNPAASDPTVRNGISCIGCHTEGMKTFEDEVRSVIESNPNPPYNKAQALRLYVEQSVMDARVREDMETYRVALEATGGEFGGIEPVSRFHEAFQGPISASYAAAVVGLETESFLERVRENTGLQNAGLLALADENGNVKRDTWTSSFRDIISALDYPDRVGEPPVITQPEVLPGGQVHFPDSNLRAAVAGALGKSANTPITAEEMKGLGELHADSRGIRDLTGIQFATNLSQLRISHSSVSDLAPLAGLVQLTKLLMDHNSVSDVSPIAGLTNLTHLDLSRSNISDISPLATLTNLKWVSLRNSNISDISAMARWEDLAWMDIARNKISDVSPLGSLTNLTWMNISNNNISDASPLEKLRPNMQWLGLYNNPYFAPGGPKILGPWLWLLLPDASLPSGTDLLSEASGGAITELTVATQGVTVGTSVGNSTWTLDMLPHSEKSNIRDMLQDSLRNGTIYGSLSLYSPREQQTLLYVGSANSLKVWLNGVLVNKVFDWRSGNDYTDAIPVTLNPGRNVLLVAVAVRGGDSEGFFGFSPDAEYTLRVGYDLSTTSIHVGDTFALDIRAENVIALAGWQFDLDFDPAVLEALDVSEGDFLKTDGGTTFFQPGRINNAAGKITGLIAGRISEGGVNGSGSVVQVRFKAKSEGETKLAFENFLFGSANDESIPALPLEIRFTVEERLLTGDVNRDGVVNILDLLRVARQLGQRVAADSPVDINGDGIVNIFDLTLVAQGIAGAAAPAVATGRVDAATLEAWIAEARMADDGSIAFRQGIANLRSLLTALIIPEETALHANYPNPFNPETWIPYQLETAEEVTLTIYGMNGGVVQRLEVGHQAAGIYRSRNRALYWDGRNHSGESVASGLYFYTLTAGDFTATRKMLIRK